MTRRPWLAGGLLSALALFVAMVMGPTGASYIASVTNNTDKARTNPYWTCYEAEARHYFPITQSSDVTPEMVQEFNRFEDGVRYMRNFGNLDLTDLIHNDFHYFPDSATFTIDGQPQGPCPRDPSLYATSQLVRFESKGSLQMFSEYAGFIETGTVYTAVAWFKTSYAGGVIMGQFEDGSDYKSFSHVLYVGSDGMLYLGENDGNTSPPRATSLSSQRFVADGAWHFAAMRSSSDGKTIYLDVDGQEVSRQWATAPIATGVTQRWRWGSSNISELKTTFVNLSDIQFRGYLAASAVYKNRSLSKSDIDNIYYAGKR